MSEQDTALEQLYSDERLTSNLTDTQAKALLEWAATQIRAGAAVASVRSAAAAANRDGSSDSQQVIAVATAALSSAGTNVRIASSPSATPLGVVDTAQAAAPVSAPPPDQAPRAQQRAPICPPRRRFKRRFSR